MKAKEKLNRVQILLDGNQQDYLSKVSKKSGKSISALVRELVAERMRIAKEEKLRNAANQVHTHYAPGGELTKFLDLDSEDWYV